MIQIHLSNQDLLAWKLTFFLFLKENVCLSETLLMSVHNMCFLWEIRKNIYLIIWLLFLARAMGSLVPGQVNWNLLLIFREIWQVGHGISTALLNCRKDKSRITLLLEVTGGLKEIGYIFSGGNTVKIIPSPSEKGSTLKGKNLLPTGVHPSGPFLIWRTNWWIFIKFHVEISID